MVEKEEPKKGVEEKKESVLSEHKTESKIDSKNKVSSKDKHCDVSDLLREGNISLILDSYDDIFSDFDPRPFFDRGLSHDFLTECRNAVKYREDMSFELRLMIPKETRHVEDEIQIKKRLNNHFQKHYAEKEAEVKKIKTHGLRWFFLGVVLLFASSLLYTYESLVMIDKSMLQTLGLNLILIIFEPAGWFFAWTGLDRYFFGAKEEEKHLEFYKKMANAKIYFQPF